MEQLHLMALLGRLEVVWWGCSSGDGGDIGVGGSGGSGSAGDGGTGVASGDGNGRW